MFRIAAIIGVLAINLVAATFFIQSISASELRDKYKNVGETGKKIKIILVPGHEPAYGGAESGALKEREMTVELALLLAEKLKGDKRLEVVLTRDKAGWNPDLQKYFDDNWEAIKAFTKLKKAEMRALTTGGEVKQIITDVVHNTAPVNVGYRLFGINRWSRDTGADILVHIHFNDYTRNYVGEPGKYKGFAIYIPDKQYSNAVATKEIAQNVFKSLEESFAVSDLPKEDSGLVESQDLIAVGQANSLDAASLLIEYGYIYRPQFASPASRSEAMAEMADKTYEGLENFFNPQK